MNVVEAYIKFNSQLIILISGISGSGASELANNISRDFKIKLISYKDYIKKEDKIPHVSLAIGENTIKFINWDSDEVIEWKEFVNEISSYKQKGVVAVCSSFPKSMYESKFSPDFHINIKLSKQNLLKRRIEYIKKEKNDISKFDDNILTNIFNKYTFPYYLQSTDVNTTKITKFINANEYAESQEYSNKLYDEAFDYLVNMITKWLENYNQKNSKSKSKRSDTNYLNVADDEFYKISTESENPDDSKDDMIVY
jgi:adenylate kinase family enzyme